MRKRLLGRTAAPAAPAIPRRAGTEPAPLSSAQRRMWFFNELERGNPVYNIPHALRLKGPLDIPALRAAFTKVVARHEILRTQILADGGYPVQVIAPAGAAPLAFRDLSELPVAAREKALQDFLLEEGRKPFDFETGQVVRGTIVRLSEREHVVFVVVHHIATDLWSFRIFFKELSTLYGAFRRWQSATLPTPPIQYADYAAWEQQWLAGGEIEAQLAYWRAKLTGAPPLLELPTAHPRPAAISFRGAVIRSSLSPALKDQLQAIGTSEGVTLFMTLLAAFKVLLFRLSHQTDIVVGTPTAGRTQPQTAGLIGLFVNTLALRSNLAGNPSFRTLLQAVKATCLDALQNQDVPFDRLVEELHPQRGAGHLPLVQVMFTLQDTIEEAIDLTELTVTPFAPDLGTARFDLTLVAEPSAAGVDLTMEYSTDLFDAPAAERILAHFQTLLEGIAAAPDQAIETLPLLTVAERELMLVEWNRTRTDFPRDLCLHQMFEAQAMARPDEIAVVAGHRQVTYRELDERANYVAARLGALGIGPEAPVGIFLGRSIEMVVAILAVLKAGGAYVPLDPAYPADRLGFILGDSRASIVLTERGLEHLLPPFPGKPVCLEDLVRRLPTARWTAPASLTPANLAYVIYTSGSTGRPKGVAIEHGNAVAFINWAGSVFSRGELDGVLAGTSLCFDLSIFELFAPLSYGGRAVIVENALALAGLPPRAGVRLLNTVPSVAAELVRSGGIPDSVETINLAGEPLSQALVEALYACPHVKRVFDLYGPSETTTYSTFTLRERGGRPAIGRPIENTELYVVDAHLQPLPVGVAGELLIGGAGVARGYLNRPLLDAEKFIPHPFGGEPGSRVYRTGDICRYRADGNLEYLGRADHQVKIRGFRVELGEIESVLSRHPVLRECVVVARDDNGERRLVAYFVPREAPPEGAELRSFLQQFLPLPLIPSAFVPVDRIPRNANGKLDRAALPIPGAATLATQAPPTPPRDETEARIARIWEDVLDARPIGVLDRFFDLGGHSLLAVRVVAQIEKEFGRRLPVVAMFEAPTVAQLAERIRRDLDAAAAQALIPVQPRGFLEPLFLVHGMGGGVIWGYANLARELGDDQPVYAFKPGEPRSQAGFDTIEEMAAQYVAELRKFQPEGPYRIGGYCFGGNIAYEMACQLEAAGQEVEVLALLNSWPSNRGHDRVHWTPVGALKFLWNLYPLARRFFEWDARTRRQFFRWKGKALLAGLRRRLHQPIRPEEPGIDLLVDLSDVPQGERKLWSAHLAALRQYRPRAYGGTAVVLRTRGYPLRCSFDHSHGWRELAAGGVTVRMVPGLHETIMVAPNVEHLARELRAELDSPSDGGPKKGARRADAANAPGLSWLRAWGLTKM